MPGFPPPLHLKVFRQLTYGLVFAVPLLAGSADSNSNAQNPKFLKSSFSGDEELIVSEKLIANSQKNVGGGSNQPQGSKSKLNPFSNESNAEPRVLIAEVIINGLDGHPEKERLEFAAYDAMTARPGSTVTRDELKVDLDAIYATGWFSGVRIEPIDGPLGVQLVVEAEPNPLLREIIFDRKDIKIPLTIVNQIFSLDYGKTLNLNSLQLRMKALKKWYSDQGYSLARISGPSRITANGMVQLKIIEGKVSEIEVVFLNKEGQSNSEDGKSINGKTRRWVIKREISIRPGETFNRKQLEADIKRLYGTSLFSDIKVTLKPVLGEAGVVKIILGITEQSTGSLSGGIGYSQSQGLFGQIGLQDTNLLGRAWSSTLNLTYGQYGGLANLTFGDPWIKGDKYRTSFRTSIFLSREVPQIFRSSEGGNIRTISDYYEGGSIQAYDIDSTAHTEGKFNSVSEASSSNPSKSWFDYGGNSVALQRTGFNFVVSRPLNGGNPYKKVPWSVLLGMNLQKVRPIDYSGKSRPYGVATKNLKGGTVPDSDIVCIAFNCAEENSLFGVRAAATYNTLNDSRNPTSGDYISIGTEQFVSVGENSPTFNRARVSYTHFIPVNWLKIAKGCRPNSGEKFDCPQTIGMQLKAGTILGQLPPYESFCLGGSNSVRGWSSCDLAVGRNFGEASVEYRFPIWNIVSGALFVDGGTDFGSQSNVPGKPGKLLDKPGSGFSLGSGLILNTPVGPLRVEAASQDFDGEWRYNLGVGWKF